MSLSVLLNEHIMNRLPLPLCLSSAVSHPLLNKPEIKHCFEFCVYLLPLKKQLY